MKIKAAGAIGVVIIGAVLAYLAVFYTGIVRFQSFTAGEFVQLMAPLFLAALFIERVLEVFVSGLRGAEEVALTGKVASATNAKLVAAKKDLSDYKAETRRWAFLGGVLLGLAVSAAGIRALGLFVDASEFEDLRQGQREFFTLLDVLLTGGVLAGGSDGLHQLVEAFTKFLQKTRSLPP